MVVLFCSSQRMSKPEKPHWLDCRPRIRNGNRISGSLGPQDAGGQLSLASAIGLSKKREKISRRICFFSMWLLLHRSM